jgi:hypothetical protein
MKRVQAAARLVVLAGAVGMAGAAAAQTPDAPAPQQPASQAPAQAPAQNPAANPGNQGGCYLPDASGKQVFVPNCGLSEAPKRRQSAQQPGAESANPFPGDAGGGGTAKQGDAPQNGGQKTAVPAGGGAASSNAFPGEDTDVPVVKSDGSIAPAGSDAGGLKDAGSSGDSSSSSSSSSSSGGGSGLSGLPDDPDSKGPLADDDTVIKKPRKKLPPVVAQTDSERVAEDLSVYGFYMDDSNYRGAYLRATDAVTHAPDDPNAHFALAEVARKLGKLDEAVAQYKKTLQLDPIPKDKKASEKAVKEMAGK